jgi:hypothetical protein
VKFLKKKTYHNRDNKATLITLVWTCTEDGRKQNSQKSIVYEFRKKRDQEADQEAEQEADQEAEQDADQEIDCKMK